MKAKIFVYALLVLILTTIHLAEGQQVKKVPRIGYVSSGYSPGPQLEALRQGLRDLGYIEEKNILIEDRYLEGNWYRTQRLVGELVKLKVDVILSSADPAINAAKRAGTVPIVMVTTQDPVAAGLIDNLARPGGNITGLTLLTRELSGKRLELLKEVVPRLRVGVLGMKRYHRLLLLNITRQRHGRLKYRFNPLRYVVLILISRQHSNLRPRNA